uniref:Uncharacterized protein n=1 Tax=Daphnia galeata TaxID=27404 RepID=A0A8J2S0G8_9CRUS|nr:unnamed protein product [Daphnia galeata]
MARIILYLLSEMCYNVELLFCSPVGLKPGFFISLDLLPVVSFNYRGYDLLLFSFPDVSVFTSSHKFSLVVLDDKEELIGPPLLVHPWTDIRDQ